MNYREAVKAYQGLVKRGAADGIPAEYRNRLGGYDPEASVPLEDTFAPVAEAPVPSEPITPTESQQATEAADLATDKALAQAALNEGTAERLKQIYAKGGAGVLQDNLQPSPMPELTPEQKYRAKLVAEADRIARLKHYGRVGGGALVGGAGAGLLSYLLAPKMSGLGRFLTVTGGATAGGAAAHYGPGVIEDITNWLAARRAGKLTPNEAAMRDNMQTMHASNMTSNEAAMRSNQKKLTGK